MINYPCSMKKRGGLRGRRLPTVSETSAGGLVLDELSPGGRGALIGRYARNGAMKWAFPKGHIEEGESAEQAALREILEETGIEARVIAPLGTVDYWFVAEGKRIHKTVHHFLLRAEGGHLHPADGEADDVAWVPMLDLPEKLSYHDERELLQRVPMLLAESA